MPIRDFRLMQDFQQEILSFNPKSFLPLDDQSGSLVAKNLANQLAPATISASGVKYLQPSSYSTRTSMTLDGVAGYVDITDDLVAVNNDFTVHFDCKVINSLTDVILFDLTDGATHVTLIKTRDVSDNDILRLDVNGTPYDSTTDNNLLVNNWSTIALTYESGVVTVYVNATKEIEETISIGTFTPTNLVFGAEYNGSYVNNSRIAIDHVAYMDIGLPEQSIKSLFYNDVPDANVVDITAALAAFKTSTFIVGNGADTTFNLPHNFASANFVARSYDTVGGGARYDDISNVDSNNATITFGSAPANNAVTVVLTLVP